MECCLDQGVGGGIVDVLISNLLRIRESPTWGNVGTWRGDETLLALLQLRTIAVKDFQGTSSRVNRWRQTM